MWRALYYNLIALRRRWYLRNSQWRSLTDCLAIENSTVAVVGNGPSVLDAQEGETIESHDIVMRFNNFDTAEEYQGFVGHRTDVWVTNCFYDIYVPNPVPPVVLCPLPITRQPGLAFKHYRVDEGVLGEVSKNIVLIPTDLFSELEGRCWNPSTGISLIYWLYRILGNSLRNIDLYGFDFFRSTAHHYYRFEGRRDHEGDQEKVLYVQMSKGNL